MRKLLLIPALGAALFAVSCQNPPAGEPSRSVPYEEKKESFEISLWADAEFLKKLLKEGYRFSYVDGSVYLTLSSPGEVKKVLALYEEHAAELKKEKGFRFAVAQLIADDAKKAREEVKKWGEQFEQIASVLEEKGVKIDFSRFEEIVLNLEREVFESYASYWDAQYNKLKSGFQFSVPEPRLPVAQVVEKVKEYYGDPGKARLFKYYLLKRLNQARLEADLYKLKEYESED